MSETTHIFSHYERKLYEERIRYQDILERQLKEIRNDGKALDKLILERSYLIKIPIRDYTLTNILVELDNEIDKLTQEYASNRVYI